ncbi:MAG: M23 family peptidase, partial [Cyclobacteriaceae bacterium]|nr:M23 family peptidase [Cyclobacteriaceae bacterium]
NGQRTYLWDLNYGIPEVIDLCTDIVYPDVIAKIPFGKEISFSNQVVEVNYLENTLLDDLFLRIEKKIQGAYRFLKINSPFDYLQGNVEILWKNTGFTGDKNYTHVYLQAVNGRKTFIGGEWESDHIRFKTRNFGTFVLEEDKISPTINPIRVNASELRFIIKDDKSGIKDFEAFLDGKWVLMRYEHKQNVIWSEKLDKQPFKGEVLLKVRDMAGNESQYVTTIK